MSARSLRRGAVICSVAATTALGLAVTPASASSMFFSKNSGTLVSADWYEIGELPGVEGNAHLGGLYAEDLGGGNANVFGWVDDFQCEAGEDPFGGGHGDGGACDYVGSRFIEGGDVTLTLDKKLSSATLTGSLVVNGGHGEGPIGTPPVNLSWTGIGGIAKETTTSTFKDENGSYSFRYSSTGRQAELSGSIGPMIVDDVEGEYSSGRISSYRSLDRSRTN